MGGRLGFEPNVYPTADPGRGMGAGYTLVNYSDLTVAQGLLPLGGLTGARWLRLENRGGRALMVILSFAASSTRVLLESHERLEASFTDEPLDSITVIDLSQRAPTATGGGNANVQVSALAPEGPGLGSLPPETPFGKASTAPAIPTGGYLSVAWALGNARVTNQLITHPVGSVLAWQTLYSAGANVLTNAQVVTIDVNTQGYSEVQVNVSYHWLSGNGGTLTVLRSRPPSANWFVLNSGTLQSAGDTFLVFDYGPGLVYHVSDYLRVQLSGANPSSGSYTVEVYGR